MDAYLLWPAFEAGRRFPYFIFDLKKREYPGAKMDLEERVVGILYSMCGLVALAIAGAVGAHQLKIIAPTRPACVPRVAATRRVHADVYRYVASLHGRLLSAPDCHGDFWPRIFLITLTGWKRTLLLSVATAAAAFAASR